MKRLVSILAVLTMTATMLSAQIVPGMKYNQLKQTYNPKEYVHTANDPYSPGWIGVGSFFIPGLGQALCGEVGRGLAFFGGSTALGIGAYVCSFNMIANTNIDQNGKVTGFKNEAAAKGWSAGLIAIGAAGFALDIWSIVDAVNVAKVKNMYNQDLLSKHAMQMQVRPSVDLVRTANGFQPAPGLTFAMQF